MRVSDFGLSRRRGDKASEFFSVKWFATFVCASIRFFFLFFVLNVWLLAMMHSMFHDDACVFVFRASPEVLLHRLYSGLHLTCCFSLL